MKYLTALALVGLVALAMPALADVLTVPGSLADASDYHVDTSDTSVWEETNEFPGLQRLPFCADGSEIVDGLCADGAEPIPADERVSAP